MAQLTMAKALNAGLANAMAADDKVVMLGQDIGRLGGVFRVTDGLQQRFGAKRVMDSPLAEAGIVGTAIGMAMRGYRTVCEIQFDGFVFPAYDQIVNQAAKLRSRSRGVVTAPIVIRIPCGGGIGAIEHHAESPEAHFAPVPGLRMVTPSNPADAYWLIQQAIDSPDPVLFFEPKRQYHSGRGEVDPEAPLSAAPARLDQAAVLRAGELVTLVGFGPTISTLLKAADVLADEGRSAEVIDLRSLAPVDYATLVASARKTGRVVVVHEAPRTAGIGAEIAARLSEECFYSLEAPVMRVTGLDMPYPPSKVEEEYLPNLDRVLDGVDRVLRY
jgi:2-oxoisovalerate dehydrogenase E1 component subunit beta